MRLTISAQVAPGVVSRLRARTERQRARIRAVNLEEAPQMVAGVQSLVPKDTEFMADHTMFEITHGGYGFLAGWWSRFFVGLTNPVTGQVVTEPYYVFVTLGTRYMAGRDALTPTLQARWPALRRKYIQALVQ